MPNVWIRTGIAASGEKEAGRSLIKYWGITLPPAPGSSNDCSLSSAKKKVFLSKQELLKGLRTEMEQVSGAMDRIWIYLVL